MQDDSLCDSDLGIPLPNTPIKLCLPQQRSKVSMANLQVLNAIFKLQCVSWGTNTNISYHYA